METTLHIYRPDQDVEIQKVDIPKEPGYQILKEIIEPLLDNQMMEHVNVLFLNQHADMFVDENGLARMLPRNDKATEIYRSNYMKQYPETNPESLPCIVGTAIVFSRRVWF